MIRAVNEFFCSYGLCREVRMGDGGHYPVLLSIAQMPGEMPGRGAMHAPGLRVQYRGHPDDLIALGCICRERLAAARFGRYEQDPRGALLLVQSKAAAGRRRMIEVSYMAQSRSFAATLPGVRLYCADWLQTLPARPLLRLVIDNTRRDPGNRAAELSARRIQRAVK